MGLFDWLKKKKVEKKDETPILIPSGGGSNALAEASPPTALSPDAAEEIAEKIMILIPYIKQYRSQGMLDDEIIAFLTEHAWPEYIVKRAIKNA